MRMTSVIEEFRLGTSGSSLGRARQVELIEIAAFLISIVQVLQPPPAFMRSAFVTGRMLSRPFQISFIAELHSKVDPYRGGNAMLSGTSPGARD
jgi:hypothetical protein